MNDVVAGALMALLGYLAVASVGAGLAVMAAGAPAAVRNDAAVIEAYLGGELA